MAKSLRVQKGTYTAICALAKGGRIAGFVHHSHRLPGKYEVRNGGSKPIKCTVTLCEKQGGRSARVKVWFTAR